MKMSEEDTATRYEDFEKLSDRAQSYWRARMHESESDEAGCCPLCGDAVWWDYNVFGEWVMETLECSCGFNADPWMSKAEACESHRDEMLSACDGYGNSSIEY